MLVCVLCACLCTQVGDPLKDTSGPSLNILVKLMAVESLVSQGVYGCVCACCALSSLPPTWFAMPIVFVARLSWSYLGNCCSHAGSVMLLDLRVLR